MIRERGERSKGLKTMTFAKKTMVLLTVPGMVLGLAQGAEARQVPGWPMPATQTEGAQIYLAQVTGGSVAGEEPDNDVSEGPDQSREQSFTDTTTEISALSMSVTPETTATTQSIVAMLNDSDAVCSVLELNYRVDCLAQELDRIAESIPEDPAFREVKAALADASAEMGELVRQNRDPDKPRVRVEMPAGSGRQSTGSLRPVSPEALDSTREAALDILDRTATVLLRSADNYEERAVEFQRVAQALDSSKVLLRSS